MKSTVLKTSLSSSIFFAGSLLLALVAAPLHAQEADPQWRVINTAPADVVPLYQGQLTPFPMEVVKVDVPTQQDLQRQADLALMNETRIQIEAMIKQPSAFLPNVNGLVADAYMKGGRGSMALIGGHWYAEQALFEVPSFKNPDILSKINFLRGLDPATAQSVTSDFAMEHAAHAKIRLQIDSIEPKQIVFKATNGKIILPIRQQAL